MVALAVLADEIMYALRIGFFLLVLNLAVNVGMENVFMSPLVARVAKAASRWRSRLGLVLYELTGCFEHDSRLGLVQNELIGCFEHDMAVI